MSDFPTPNDNSEQEAGSEKPATQDSHLNQRRDLLKAGLAVAPIILTIKSQAALGCGGTCFTPSRSLSKNTSLSHKKNVGTCSGYSPSYYLPANPKTSFCSIFADPQNKYKTKKCLNKSCSSYQLVSMTFADVLKKGPSDPAYYVVGAYLNIQKNLVAPQALTGPQLVTMWNDCAKYGKHEVMANVYWNIGQVNSYLCNSNITAD